VYRIGDIIPIRTGVILDSNGNPVSDDTPVNFKLTNGGEVSAFPQIAFTKGGIAQAKIQVTVPGLMEIRAESEPAKQSDILQFDIPPENGIIQTTTPIPEPTGTVVPSPTPTQAPIILPIPQPNFPGRPNLLDWFMSSMIILITAYISYRFAAILGQVRWGIRSGWPSCVQLSSTKSTGQQQHIRRIRCMGSNRNRSDWSSDWNSSNPWMASWRNSARKKSLTI
jgi:beta-N-acetylhexosaminidase